MDEGGLSDQSEPATLEACRSKSLRLAERIPGATVIPFDKALVD